MPAKEQGPYFTLQDITKSYGRHTVLNSLSLTFEAGEFVLLLGANGSGKSTLLRICVGLLHADRGVLSVSPKIGYAGHDLQLYGNLTVQENLTLFANLMRQAVDIDFYLADWELTPDRNRYIDDLSKGTQCRVALSRAFLAGPPLLVLDEPTAFLDEYSATLCTGQISKNRSAHRERSITLVATHDIHRFQEHANRIMVLQDGRICRDTKMLMQETGAPFTECKAEIIKYYYSINR